MFNNALQQAQNLIGRIMGGGQQVAQNVGQSFNAPITAPGIGARAPINYGQAMQNFAKPVTAQGIGGPPNALAQSIGRQSLYNFIPGVGSTTANFLSQTHQPQPTLGNYLQGNIINPAHQGFQQLGQGNPMGAFGVLRSGINVAPQTALGANIFNLGAGALSGVAKSVRTKTPLAQSLKQSVEQGAMPSSGLGIKNPLLAMGTDIALTGGLNGVGKDIGVAAGLLGKGSRAKGINPVDMESIMGVIKRKAQNWMGQDGKIDLNTMTQDHNLVGELYRDYIDKTKGAQKVPVDQKIQSLYDAATYDFRNRIPQKGVMGIAQTPKAPIEPLAPVQGGVPKGLEGLAQEASKPPLEPLAPLPSDLHPTVKNLFAQNEVPASMKPPEPPQPIDPVKKITDALKNMQPFQSEQAQMYSQARAERFGSAQGVLNDIGGQAGFQAAKGQMKGELPNVQFQSIAKNFTQPDINYLFDKINQNPHLTMGEKLNASTGLEKLLGAEGAQLPAPREMELLNQVYGNDFTQAILDKRPMLQKAFDMGGNIIGIPRSLLAGGFDMSYGLRQGIFNAYSFPKEWGSAFKEQFKYFSSDKALEALHSQIISRPTYPLMKESGLALTNLGAQTSKREEQFVSSLAEKIPFIGKFVRASGRAYTGFANKFRADIFDSMVKDGQKTGAIERPDYLRSVADFVNTATGRGKLTITGRGTSQLEQAAGALSTALFSPRLLASRLQTFNPLYYASLDKSVRMQAIKSLGAFVTASSTILGLAKLAGADVGTDPTNADFGKIKIGKTRIDILGGFQQPIVLAARLFENKTTNSMTGRVTQLNSGPYSPNRLDIASKFLQNKESPVMSFFTGLMSGTNAIGQPFNVPTEVMNRVVPMFIQDVYDLYQQGGQDAAPLALPASFFGAGVQTYGYTPTGKKENQQAVQLEKQGVPKNQINDLLLQRKQVESQRANIKDQLKANQAKPQAAQYNPNNPIGLGQVQAAVGDHIPQLPGVGGFLQGLLHPNQQPQQQADPYVVPTPQYTNNPTLDERVNSQYKTDITAMQKSVMEDYKLGAISQQQAAQKILDLTKQEQTSQLAKPLTPPEKTGSDAIDLLSLKSYDSQLTTRINQVMAAYRSGAIPQQQAANAITSLQDTQKSVQLTIKGYSSKGSGGSRRTRRLTPPRPSRRISAGRIASVKTPRSASLKGTKIKMPKIPVASTRVINSKKPQAPHVSYA